MFRPFTLPFSFGGVSGGVGGFFLLHPELGSLPVTVITP